MKRFISYLMVCVIFLSLSAGAGVLAADIEPANDVGYIDISPYASQFLASHRATARRAGSGVLNIDFSVQATARFERVGALTITIQQRVGNTWRDVATFGHSTTAGMIANNTGGHSGTVTFNGVAGVEYRAIVVVFAGNATGDQRTITTNTVVL